jgi:modification methylase
MKANAMLEPQFLDQILQGNTFDILPTLPERSVDLIFADPPYNLQLRQELWRPNMTKVDAVDDAWDQFDGFDAYDDFTRRWLIAARRVMKPTATLWISGTYHNIFRVGAILQDLGFWLLNTIAWFKRNATPNFRGTRLKNDVEWVIWAKYSDQSRYTFNHRAMKQFNGGKQLGSVWDIPVCGGHERLKDESGQKLHPTQKPEELLKRIILASSQPEDVVLDPFVGSGTTAVVAKQLHRHWIGIDNEAIYVNAARARVAAVPPLDRSDPSWQTAALEAPARIPFSLLLERGYLRAGQMLRLKHSDHQAVILDDGSLRANGVVGSIHRVGAALKKTPSCNGWSHWFYFDEEAGQYQLIDTLRQKVRMVMSQET